MPHLVWTDLARSDVNRLHRFLRSKSLRAANNAVDAIFEGVELLASFPEAGRSVEEKRGQGHREWIVRFGSGSYIILYQYVNDVLSIAAVRHSREADYPGLSGS